MMVTVTLMTFDKQSNGRRIEVDHITTAIDHKCASVVRATTTNVNGKIENLTPVTPESLTDRH